MKLTFVCCKRTAPNGKNVNYCMPIPRDAIVLEHTISDELAENLKERGDADCVMVQLPLTLLFRLFPDICERHAQAAAVA